MTEAKPSAISRHKNWLTLGMAVLILYVILPHIGAFHASTTLLRHVRPGEVALAVVFAYLTYVAAAGTYSLLAFHKLHYFRTIAIELSGMFLNRLIPAGLGNIGVNYRYLRQNKHSGPEAGSVVAVNNTLGFVGHMLLLSFLLLTVSIPSMNLRLHASSWIVTAAGLTGIVLLAVVFSRFNARVRKSLNDFFRQVYMFRRRPLRLLAAMVTSISLTLSNVTALLLCVHAYGFSINFLTALIVFTFGLALGTATPTPGGLGGYEAGLVAGLVAYDFSSAQALAIVLTYRLITYWLALLTGAASFLYVQRRGYI